MAPPDWLWAVFTVTAAGMQTVRNAAQRGLTQTVGTQGATAVRFIYGLPFALVFLALVAASSGPIPRPNLAFFCMTLLGALSQILATGLLLHAMRERAFVVVVAYSKTEPVQVALFSVVVLHEFITLPVSAAILAATIGVVVMSWPKKGPAEAMSLRPAVLGIASGAFFALSAIGFRGGILALEAGFLTAATTTLAAGLAIQTLVILAWGLLRERAVLMAVLKAWKPSLIAGAAGATASQFWFLAFALESAARVRTLALVEILFAQAISAKIFREGLSGREWIGLALVVLGIVVVVNV